jgi:hypothetical protein
MPRARKPFIRAALPAAGLLALAGLAAPAAFSPATADPMAPHVPLGAPVKWSAEIGPVPGAATNTAPALADVSLPGKASALLLFWTGPADDNNGFRISYQTAINLAKNHWSLPALVVGGKAVTRNRPSAAPFASAGSGQVIVAWKSAGSPQVLYSLGQVGKGNTLSWSAISAIPGAATSAGPAVFQPLHSDAIVVAWKAATGNAVDDIVGLTEPAGGVKWGKVGVIPMASTTRPPTIAEASTGSGSGRVYVLWQGPGTTGPVDYATTADPVSLAPKWTSPRSLPSSVRTGAAPSAQAIGKSSSYPLLVVFRAQHGPALLYVTLASNGKVTGPLGVPRIRSLNGTAISPGVLAAEAPDPGSVFLEPFVRPCPGC